MAFLRLRKTRIVFGADGRPKWVRVVNWGAGGVVAVIWILITVIGIWTYRTK